MLRGERWVSLWATSLFEQNVLIIPRLVLLTPGLLVPKSLLPALVECLGLVHAVPVVVSV